MKSPSFSKNPIIIAIDGHSSCGKSTLAKALAKALNYVYIDTGAMYRAVTLYFLRQEIRLKDKNQVSEALNSIQIEFKNMEGKNTCFLNGEDVEEEIRSLYVSDHVSDVAAIAEVRKKMVNLQREAGKSKGIVMDGRDIGSVVFPDAELKLFVTASHKIRGLRRYQELTEKGIQVSLEEVLDNIAKRDHIDSTREVSPLKRVKDAILMDNSHLNRQEQLDLALEYVHQITG